MKTKPKFRAFLQALLPELRSASYARLAPCEKTANLQEIVAQHAEHPSFLAIYRTYSYKSLISDVCSDILYNVKRSRYETLGKLEIFAYFLGFFHDFQEICQENEENEGKVLLLRVKDAVNVDCFENLLSFLANELKLTGNRELLQYVLEIARIAAPLLQFYEDFVENIEKVAISLSFRSRSGEFEEKNATFDAFPRLSPLRDVLAQCFCDKELSFYQETAKTATFSRVFLDKRVGFQGEMLRVLLWLRKVSQLQPVFRDSAFQQRIFEAMVALLPGNPALFVEVLDFLREFSKDFARFRSKARQMLSKSAISLVKAGKIALNLNARCDFVDFWASFARNARNCVDFDDFSLIFELFEAILQENCAESPIFVEFQEFLLQIVKENVEKFESIDKFQRLVPVLLGFLRDLQGIPGKSLENVENLLHSLVFSVFFSAKAAEIPLAEPAFLRYFSAISKKTLANAWKMLEFQEFLQLFGDKLLHFCADLLESEDFKGSSEDFTDFPRFFCEVLRKTAKISLKLLKNRGFFANSLRKPRLFQRNREILAQILVQEAFVNENSLNFYHEILEIELKLLANQWENANFVANLANFLDFFETCAFCNEKLRRMLKKSSFQANVLLPLDNGWKSQENRAEIASLLRDRLENRGFLRRTFGKYLKISGLHGNLLEFLKENADLPETRDFCAINCRALRFFVDEVLIPQGKPRDLLGKVAAVKKFDGNAAKLAISLLKSFSEEIAAKSVDGLAVQSAIFAIFRGFSTSFPTEIAGFLETFAQKLEKSRQIDGLLDFFEEFVAQLRENRGMPEKFMGNREVFAEFPLKSAFSLGFWLKIRENQENSTVFTVNVGISCEIHGSSLRFSQESAIFVEIPLKFNEWTLICVSFSDESRTFAVFVNGILEKQLISQAIVGKSVVFGKETRPKRDFFWLGPAFLKENAANCDEMREIFANFFEKPHNRLNLLRKDGEISRSFAYFLEKSSFFPDLLRICLEITRFSQKLPGFLSDCLENAPFLCESLRKHGVFSTFLQLLRQNHTNPSEFFAIFFEKGALRWTSACFHAIFEENADFAWKTAGFEALARSFQANCAFFKENVAKCTEFVDFLLLDAGNLDFSAWKTVLKPIIAAISLKKSRFGDIFQAIVLQQLENCFGNRDFPGFPEVFCRDLSGNRDFFNEIREFPLPNAHSLRLFLEICHENPQLLLRNGAFSAFSRPKLLEILSFVQKNAVFAVSMDLSAPKPLNFLDFAIISSFLELFCLTFAETPGESETSATKPARDVDLQGIFEEIRVLAPFSLNFAFLSRLSKQNSASDTQFACFFASLLTKTLEFSCLCAEKSAFRDKTLREVNETLRISHPQALLLSFSLTERVFELVFGILAPRLGKAAVCLENQGFFPRICEAFVGNMSFLLRKVKELQEKVKENAMEDEEFKVNLNEYKETSGNYKETSENLKENSDIYKETSDIFKETSAISKETSENLKEISENPIKNSDFQENFNESLDWLSDFLVNRAQDAAFPSEGLYFLDKLLLICEETLPSRDNLRLKLGVWRHFRAKPYCDARLLINLSNLAILQQDFASLLEILRELREKHAQKPVKPRKTAKKTSFIETFLRKSFGAAQLPPNFCALLQQLSAKCLTFARNSQEIGEILAFLHETPAIFFEVPPQPDILATFLEKLWEIMHSEGKELRDSAILLLGTLTARFKESVRKLLEFYEFSAFDKGFDFLLEKRRIPLDFFVFVSYQDVHCRLEMVISKKLRLISQEFLKEIDRKAAQDAKTPIVFAENVEFLEYLGETVGGFPAFGREKCESCGVLPRKWSFFGKPERISSQIPLTKSEHVESSSTKDQFSTFCQRFVQELAERSRELATFRDKLRFVQEKSRRNARKSLAILTKLRQPFHKTLAFSLKTARLGPHGLRPLVFCKEISQSISKERRFSWLSAGSLPRFAENSLISQRISQRFSRLSRTFRAEVGISSALAQKLKSPGEKWVRSREAAAFFRRNGVFSEALDCFSVGLLKEREYFLDGVALICADSLVFLLNFELSDGKVREIATFSAGDKSKYLLRSSEMRQKPKEAEKPVDKAQKLPVNSPIIIRKSEVCELHTRRYWLKPLAFELFTTKRSLFFIVNQHKRNKILAKLLKFLDFDDKTISVFRDKQEILLISPPTRQILTASTHLKAFTRLWQTARVSTHDYLQILNVFAGRTYQDLAQYPVFPWVLTNYHSESLDFAQENCYRDFSRPIGALTEDRARLAREKFQATKEENSLFPPFHYGSHYSSAVLVLYYLLRLMPFAKYSMNLQGGRFDLSDRLFHSFPETWALANSVDFKELIPEVFSLPEFLLNVNSFDFGEMQSKSPVNDVTLPDWAQDPRFFVMCQRKALEAAITSRGISHWFDLIFGYKQRGKPAVDALNLFYFLTYEDSVQLEEIDDEVERNAYLDQINEYGQTPKQLFTVPHVLREKMPASVAVFSSLDRMKSLKKTLIFSEKSLRQLKPLREKSASWGFFLEKLVADDCEDGANEWKPSDFLRKNELDAGDLGVLFCEWEKSRYFLRNASETDCQEIPSVELVSCAKVAVSSSKTLLIQGDSLGNLHVRDLQCGFPDERAENALFPDISQEKTLFPKAHSAKILILETCESLQLLISLDRHGVLCAWDLISLKFLRKTRVYLFADPRDFSEVFPFFGREPPFDDFLEDLLRFPDKRSCKSRDFPLEKPKKLSVCEENGDFCVVSRRCLSVLTANCVLLASFRGESLCFSTVSLQRNARNFEDDYVLTGDLRGEIMLFLLRPKRFSLRNGKSLEKTRNLFAEHYRNKPFLQENVWRIVCPYELVCVYKTCEGMDRVRSLQFSRTQREMVTVNGEGDVFLWTYDKKKTSFQANDAKCQGCDAQVSGLLESKAVLCGDCAGIFCESCCCDQVFLPEIDLRKKTRVCKSCFTRRKTQKLVGLYDNYQNI